MITIDENLLGIIVTIALGAIAGVIALAVKLNQINNRIKQLETNPLITGWAQFNREQAIDMFDKMIRRIEEPRGESDHG